ncbi:MAG: ribosomal protein S18-alanine N-acetyltransferase [Blastocatellia bacterium]
MAVFQSIRNLFISTQELGFEAVVPAPETEYSIAPLTKKQINEVLRLNLRCFKNGENYNKSTFTYLLNEPNSLSYRATAETGEMTGFVFVMVNHDGAAHITTIGVAPEHRRRGLAERLLKHTEEALRAKGVSTVVLEVRISNMAAQSLYSRAGYAVTQRMGNYYSNGEDGYLMMKSLV